jgi:YfiH family protein
VTTPELLRVDSGDVVAAAFTTRRGGRSEGPWRGANLATSTGDRPEDVRANRRALCDALGVDATRLSMPNQVHGADVVRVVGPLRPGRFCGGLRGWPRADAVVTDRVGLGLLVLAADCVPVLVWREDGSGVGAIHSGWRGMMAGVIGAAVAALPGAGPLRAAVGPCIGRSRYEVDGSLADRFARRFGEGVRDGRLLDLRACATLSLGEAGVEEGGIAQVAHCTAGQPERFFSHRRDGPATGRQAGVIVRTRPSG